MGVKRVRPVEQIVRPFQYFADKASSGGILLIVAAVVALVWANSPWGGELYRVLGDGTLCQLGTLLDRRGSHPLDQRRANGGLLPGRRP